MTVAAAAVRAGTLLSLASLALTVDNLRRLRVPLEGARPGPEPLAVLLPVRDEVDVVEDCVTHLLAAVRRWPGPARLVVLDDGSTDGTSAVLADLARTHDTLEVVTGAAPPPGWLGKPWACQQLAEAVGAVGAAGPARPGCWSSSTPT